MHRRKTKSKAPGNNSRYDQAAPRADRHRAPVPYESRFGTAKPKAHGATFAGAGFHALKQKVKAIGQIDIARKMEPDFVLCSESGQLEIIAGLSKSFEPFNIRFSNHQASRKPIDVLNICIKDIQTHLEKPRQYDHFGVYLQQNDSVKIRLGGYTCREAVHFLPVYYLPFLEKNYKALYDLWRYGIGLLSQKGIMGLDDLIQNIGFHYDELHDGYHPNQADYDQEDTAATKEYKMQHQDALDRYSQDGQVYKYVKAMRGSSKRKWLQIFGQYRAQSNMEREFMPLLKLLAEIIPINENLNKEYFPERSEYADEGCIHPGEHFQVVWSDEPEKELMTSIRNDYIDSQYNGYGAAPPRFMHVIKLGDAIPKYNKNMLPVLLEKFFDEAVRVIDRNFLYQKKGEFKVKKRKTKSKPLIDIL